MASKKHKVENMKKEEIYIFLFDEFSDWEIAYLNPLF